MRDAIGLVGRLDEHFFYAADIVAEGVVGLGADDFCGVQHGCSLVVRAASSKATSTTPRQSRPLHIQVQSQLGPPEKQESATNSRATSRPSNGFSCAGKKKARA